MHPWLGKVLFMLLLLLPLSASVKITAPNEVYEGEAIVFRIITRGFTVKFPEIDFIDNQLVEEVKSTSEAYMIGIGKATQTTKVYQVVAQKDFFIPALSFEIDGAIVKSQTHKVKVKKRQKTLSSNYDLQMHLNKTQAHLGEALILKMIFTYKDLEDYLFITPEFPNFTIKNKSTNTWKTSKGEFVESQTFTLVAQQAGSFVLSPSKVEVEYLKKKQSFKKRKAAHKTIVYSNELHLEVLKLPKGVSVVGRYEMMTTVFNQRVKKGEPVKMRLQLRGKGNINNLEAFTFKIPRVTIYTHNDANNTLRKDFTMMADEDFEIPPLSLTYFDTSRQQVMKITSPKYVIKVGEVRTAQTEKKKIPVLVIKKLTQEKKEKPKDISMIEKIVYFLLGVFITLLLVYLYKKIQEVKHAKQSPF